MAVNFVERRLDDVIPQLQKSFPGVFVMFLLFTGLYGSSRLFAQVVGSTVTGTVTDATGAATPHVTVSIANVGTGVVTKAETNSAGFYIAPNLAPGGYRITATATGFANQVPNGITLTVGLELVLNLSMKVGSNSETVTVTSEAPAVELANATFGGVTNARTIEEIPLNGRSWTDLANLQPGVQQVQDQPPINAPDRVKPPAFKADTPGSATPRGVRQFIFGTYVEDDVHVRSNLTLNLGLRYEMASISTEVVELDGSVSKTIPFTEFIRRSSEQIFQCH